MQLPAFKEEAEDLEIPDKLNTPQFRDAWVAWCGHKRQRGKALTAQQALPLLKRLSTMKTASRARRLIEYALDQDLETTPNAGDISVAYQELTEEEVTKYAAFKKVDVKAARKFYQHFRAQGWKLANDKPMTDWKIRLVRWCEDNADREREESGIGSHPLDQVDSNGVMVS